MLTPVTAIVGGLLALGPATAQDRSDPACIPTHDGFLEVETATRAVREVRRALFLYR